MFGRDVGPTIVACGLSGAAGHWERVVSSGLWVRQSGGGTYSEGGGRLFVALIRIVMGRSGRVTEALTECYSGLGRVRRPSLGSVR